MIHYQAPEVVIGTLTIDSKVDVWSAGCVMAEMARGPLFTGDSLVDQLMQICSIFGKPKDWPEFDEFTQDHKLPFPEMETDFDSLFDQTVDRNFVDLLKKMLVMNPAKRITAYEGLNHPYFSNVPPELRDMCVDNLTL